MMMSQTICIDCTADGEEPVGPNGYTARPSGSQDVSCDTAKATSSSKAADVVCTICLESMEEEGAHRAVCLKCGHIFGQRCIQRWLAHKKSCPQCNERAKPGNITVLYNLPRVRANKDVDELQQRLKAAEEERRRLQQELQRIRSSFASSGAPCRTFSSFGAQGAGAPPSGTGQPLQQHPHPAWPGAHPGITSFQGLTPGPAGMPWPSRSALSQPQGVPVFSPHVAPPQQQGIPGLRSAVPGSAPGRAAGPHPAATYLPAASPSTPPNPRNTPLPSQPPASHNPATTTHQAGLQAGGNFQQALPLLGPANTGVRRLPSSIASVNPAACAVATQSTQHSSGGRLPAAWSAAASSTTMTQPAFGAAVGLNNSCPIEALQAPAAKRMRVGEPESIDLTNCSTQEPLEMSLDTEVVVSGPSQMAAAPEVLPCHLVLSQIHNVAGARCFDMDVQSAILVIPDILKVGRNPAGQHRIRKLSLLCPDTPAFMPLPSCVEMVRCCALQHQRQLLLVGTKGAHVVMLSTRSNNRVAEFKLPGPQSAWASSASWLPDQPDQALIGFSTGTVALMDLRNTSTALQIMAPRLPVPGQVHTILSLPSKPPMPLSTSPEADNTSPQGLLSQQAHAATQQPLGHASVPAGVCTQTGKQPQCLSMTQNGVASSQHVNSSVPGPDTQNVIPDSPGIWLAASPTGACRYRGLDVVKSWSCSALGRGTCESVCFDPHSSTAVLSFRSSPSGGAVSTPAAHVVMQGVGDGQQPIKIFELRGHTSMRVMTRSCLLGALPEAAGLTWLAGADETSCCPWIWSLQSKHVVQVLEPHPSPVLQLSAGFSEELGYILAASCSQQLKLYSMHSRE